MEKFDVIVIGGGAAGMMCGIESAKRYRKTLVIEHNKQIGNKILISGGGRCNFINREVEPSRFTSENKHFNKSALSRYTQWDFIDLVESHKIDYYEKTLGQLFCTKNSREIIKMLLLEAEKAEMHLKTDTKVQKVEKIADNQYQIVTNKGEFECESLVIATGGLSFQNRGATDFSYRIATQFELELVEPEPGLVPITLDPNKNLDFTSLSGISFFARVFSNKASFKESVLFSHKGMSGPAILQISNYLDVGDKFFIEIEPEKNIPAKIEYKRRSKSLFSNILSEYLPERLAKEFVGFYSFDKPLNQFNDKEFDVLINHLTKWELQVFGTEGFKKAEITKGGLDTKELSSKTFETNKHKGLYFIGESIDVNGWLGGYNFAWAWSSGWAAGQYV